MGGGAAEGGTVAGGADRCFRVPMAALTTASAYKNQISQHVGPHGPSRGRQLFLRAAAASGDGHARDLDREDWRSFRARLVAQTKGDYNAATRVENPNAQLLQLQSPVLAAEGMWAHATPAPEAGGLLMATHQTAGLLGPDYWQAVVFLLQHTSRGSMGLVLNRPTNARVDQGPDGLPTTVHGTRDGHANSRLYWGGNQAEHVFTLLHGGEKQLLPGSREVAPGISVLFGQTGVAQAAAGDIAQAGAPLRFFLGACAWGPGELELQIEQGAWTTAAASRSLVLKHCLQLPVPLWRELACLMGGECTVQGASEACQE